MSVEMIPSDLVIRDRVGLPLNWHSVVRGDTVSFTYENEERTVLVMENQDGVHLKGVAKERGADFRNYLRRKILNLRYAKPFVKAVPVTTVKFELLPQPTPAILPSQEVHDVDFVNRKGDKLKVRFYRDGSVNCYKNYRDHAQSNSSMSPTSPLDVLTFISNFLTE